MMEIFCSVSSLTMPMPKMRVARKNPKGGIHWSRHPLIVLLVGAIISSILVPIIANIISERRGLQSARHAKAAEVIKACNQINRQINLLVTTFSHFERDVTTYPLTDDEYRLEQKELRKQIYMQYGEFDSYAWWVFHDISAEAAVGGIVPQAKITCFYQLIAEYNSNLTEATKQLSVIWEDFLRARSSSKDRPETKVGVINSELKKLQQARSQITEKMVRVFE